MKTKVTIDQKGLKAALAVLATVVPSKSSLPILGDVMLSYDAQKDMFALTASDGEKWLTLECVNSDGQNYINMMDDDRKDPMRNICLDFKSLREAIALLPTGQLLQVWFDGDAHTMKVDYMLGQFSMPWEESDEFPMAPAVADQGSQNGVLQAVMKTEQLLPWLKQARVCVATDMLRPVMEGVCLDVSHEGIVVVSSSGHTLYKKVLDMGVGGDWLRYGRFDADKSASVLVHKSALQPIDAAFGSSEKLTITVDTQRTEWRTENAVLVTRQIEGHYPNYNSVIPKDNPHVISVDARSLTGALRRISLFAAESIGMATLSREGDKLLVAAEDIDYSKSGSERVAIAAETTMPEQKKFGFKIANMIELLSMISTETAILYLSDPSHAVLIKEETNNQDLTLLIMPMLVNE